MNKESSTLSFVAVPIATGLQHAPPSTWPAKQ